MIFARRTWSVGGSQGAELYFLRRNHDITIIHFQLQDSSRQSEIITRPYRCRYTIGKPGGNFLVTDRIWLKRFTGAGNAPNRLDAILFESLSDLAQDADLSKFIL